MVKLTRSEISRQPASSFGNTSSSGSSPLKLEIDDSSEEEHGPLSKRSRSSSSSSSGSPSPFVVQLYTGKVLFPGATSNEMLRLLMDLQGSFPKKMLRKGTFTHEQFDRNLNFLLIKADTFTNKVVKKLVYNVKPKGGDGIVFSYRDEHHKTLHGIRESNEFPIPPSQYNPLDEPSPLGLRLRKSPSLLDLIQMKLSQGNAATITMAPSGNFCLEKKKDVGGTTTTISSDKMKASNFPATLLRIGSWEYVSRHEGDLVAKCYFAKHKLVWEVLDGCLKSKIEIQWSDIMGLKANCPDDGPGTLTVVLARQPLFFRETNPQPRKHTLWQAAADFTDGQASMHRQHFLQCSQGQLNRHYEKLIQCDMRLNFLCQQPDIVQSSPYFELRASDFEDQDKPKDLEHNNLETSKRSPISGIHNVASPSGAKDTAIAATESKVAPSPSSGSGIDQRHDLKGLKNWEQLNVPGLSPSMSMTDLVSHIGQCISGQMTSANGTEKASECQEMLEDIAKILLSDTQFATASDEKSLMKKVNSLCCLLQGPAEAEDGFKVPNDGRVFEFNHDFDSTHEDKTKEAIATSEQAPTMSRIDSFGDLLLRLPQIASLPRFLFDISEDDQSRH